LTVFAVTGSAHAARADRTVGVVELELAGDALDVDRAARHRARCGGSSAAASTMRRVGSSFDMRSLQPWLFERPALAALRRVTLGVNQFFDFIGPSVWNALANLSISALGVGDTRRLPID
jgi:hypothetical protein